MRKGFFGAVALGIIIIVGIIVLCSCTTRVPAGYIAVQYNIRGGIEGEVLTQGFHVVSPMIKTTLYSIGIEQSYLTSDHKGDSPHDESFNTPTADGKSLTVDLEFSYQFDESVITSTFTRFKGRSGEEIKDTFIKPKMVAWTQEVTAKYPVTDVFGDKRQELNEALDEYLKEKFLPYGIIIDTVNFTNISTDEETAEAIQRKVNAQQEYELAQIESNTAQVNAERERKVAEVAAEQARIVAQGEADAALITAEAEAKANKLISSSLTDELITKEAISKWSGNVPEVMGESSILYSLIQP